MNLPAAPPPDHRPQPAEPTGQVDAVRRRRLAEIFGDVLPDTTGDERGTDVPADAWYLENRPPHHG